MGVPASRLSLLAVLALSAPAALVSLALPLEARAQQAAFADTVFELVPPGEVVADGLTPVTMSFVALGADGSPLTGVVVKATVGGGKVGSVDQVMPGVYKVSWTPPKVDAARSFDVFIKGKTADKKTIDKKWSVKVVPTLAQQVTITSSPAQIVLGQDTSATLNITLGGGPSQPLDGVELDVRATAGTVANVTHLGGGKFTALYTPPEKPYPQLALITVGDRRDPTRTYGAVGLALIGKGSFAVKGLPNSRIIVKVADREFGPIQADGNGNAQVPLVVPPGFDKGTTVSVAGDQRKEEELPLPVPPSPRLAFFPVPRALPADAAVTLPVRVFVTNAQGAPDAAAQLTLTASAGTITPVRHEGNGVYVASYTPPTNSGASANIQAVLADSRGNQTSTLALSLVPTRPSSVKLTVEPTTLPATGGSLRVIARVTGPDNQGLSARNLVFGVDGAQLQGGVKDLGAGDYQATFSPTGNGPVDLVATVTAKASGNPLRQVLAFTSRDRLPNDGLSSTMITVLTLDEFGYPVANVPLKIGVTQGDGKVPAQGRTNDTGVAQIYYTAGRNAGMANLEIVAGDHMGNVSVLQTPPGVATSFTMPQSGSDTTLRLAGAWRNIVKGVRVERQGAPVVAPIATAAPSAWGAGGGSGLAVQKLSVLANPSTATPGQTVELEISALDSQGQGVDSAVLEFLASQGEVSAARPSGGGKYKATLTVPSNATGEIKVSVALSDGSTSSFLKIPVGAATAAASTASGWGGGGWGTEGGASTTTTPATVAPTTTTTPATPATTAATLPTTTPEPAAGTTTRERTPINDGDRPWLRVAAGYAGGLYSYAQEPIGVYSPLYDGTIAFGTLSDTEGSTPAPASGVQVGARAWIPGARWLGVDAGLRSTYYSVQIPTASALIPDWVTSAHVWGVPRYRFGSGENLFHVGARAGLSIGDLMVYQQPQGSSSLSYSPLPVPALDVGAELGAEIGSRLFGTLGYTLGLANASALYARGFDLNLGFAFSDHLTANLSVGSLTRDTDVYLNFDDEKLNTASVGTVADKAMQLGIGIGYQL